MDSEKLNDILKDESFMKEVLKSDSAEEFKALFKSKGIDLSDQDVEEIVDVVSEEINNPIEECELENVSGGNVKKYFSYRGLKNISKSVLILSIAGSLVYFARKGGKIMDSTANVLDQFGNVIEKFGSTVDAATGAVEEAGGVIKGLEPNGILGWFLKKNKDSR